VSSEVASRMVEMYEAGDLITTCAWCGRIDVGGEWLIPPSRIFTVINAPTSLSHSICPRCETRPRVLGPPLPDPRSDPSFELLRTV
jgi:hypothetical protein